ncbi:MAG TPA: hypothetical protein VFG76_04265, partial [Candidatus Polarisedimenticolia bacterium]|nr:hypothetical protein [Candidatus Polarisedimenticolia bacterium]
MIRSRPGRAGYGYRFWFQHRLYERGGFPTRRAARSAEEIARARAGARRQSEATSVTLAEYATLWLAGLEGELARKTIRD